MGYHPSHRWAPGGWLVQRRAFPTSSILSSKSGFTCSLGAVGCWKQKQLLESDFGYFLHVQGETLKPDQT